MSPQDRPKVIALVVAIVLVIGFVLKTLLKPREEPAPPPVVAQTQPPATTERPGLNNPGSLVKSGPVSVAYTGINPFRTVLPGGGSAPAGNSGGSAINRADNAVKPPPLGGRGTDFSLTGIPGVHKDGTAPYQVTPPAQAEIKIEGVAIDQRGRMAIVSSGGKTEYLRVGQKFGDGFIVARIEPGAVTFERKGKLLRVEVGSTLGGPSFERLPNLEG